MFPAKCSPDYGSAIPRVTVTDELKEKEKEEEEESVSRINSFSSFVTVITIRLCLSM